MGWSLFHQVVSLLLQKLLFSSIFPIFYFSGFNVLVQITSPGPSFLAPHTSTAERWLLSSFWSLLLKNNWSRGLDSCSPPLHSHGLAAFAFHTFSEVLLVTAAVC